MKLRRLFIFGILVLAAGLALRFAMQRVSLIGSISGHTTPLIEPIPAYTRSLHPNFPYSVIPGGAYSTAELCYADREDGVVKEHYADFNLKNARMVQLTEDKYQYVSYRIKQKVYWTKKRLRIPKGELLLTDGVSYARARCGNRLSEKPHMQQTSDSEPPTKALLAPPMQLGVPMEFARNPPLGELSKIDPVDAPRLGFVQPSPAGSVAPNPEMGLLAPFLPIIPIGALVPPAFLPLNSSSNPPVSPPITPPLVLPGDPALIPPDTAPHVSLIPEPRAIYLFLVTFVLSLYGLTRMVPGHEKKESAQGE